MATEATQPPGQVEGSSGKAKLFPTALLANRERNELHTEIYTYFKWLEQSMISAKCGRRASNAGLSISGVQNVLKIMTSEIRSVRCDAVVLNKVAEDFAKGGKVPFLERYTSSELKRRLEETEDQEVGIRVGGRLKSWEERYADLIQHQHMVLNCTYQEMNGNVPGLGDWLQKQRWLYAKKDAKFMKNQAPKLDAIRGFQWKQPKIKKKAKATPPVMKRLPKSTQPQLPAPHLYPPDHAFPVIYHQGPHPPPPTAVGPPPVAPKKSRPAKKGTPSKPYDFETEFNLMVEYKTEHGDCNAPYSTRLGRWAYSLRQKRTGTDGNVAPDNPSNDCDSDGITALATAATAGDTDAFIIRSVQAPPGRLGLEVHFVKDKEEEGAVITSVYASCPFKNNVKAGDRVVMIDGISVSKPEDLSIGIDKARAVGIATKKKPQRQSNVLLTQEQIQRLDSIGFNWKGSGRFRPWEHSFQDLLAYYQTHGDFRVPRTYRTPQSHHLGEWVHRQRFRYGKKEPTFMKDRAPKLDAIGFEWKPMKNHFESNFKELVEYKKKMGNVDVPCNNSRNNSYRVLGRWVASIRYTKKRLEEKEQSDSAAGGKKSQRGGHAHDYLTVERIKLLDSIGFDWTGTALKRSGKKDSLAVDIGSEEQAIYDEWAG